MLECHTQGENDSLDGVECLPSAAEEAAEKVNLATSAAKAGDDNAALIAALKQLRHPKPKFFRSLWSRKLVAAYAASFVFALQKLNAQMVPRA